MSIDPLNEVMTAKEASKTFGISRFTVIDAIRRKQIDARQSGGTWLIRRADAERRWGNKERKSSI